MTKIFSGILFLFVVSLSISCRGQKAAAIVAQKLQIIDRKVHRDSTLNLNEVEPAINFLEQTTGIKSHSNGNYIGRFQPTLVDYQNWLNWFQNNKDSLYWDSKERKVKLKRKQ